VSASVRRFANERQVPSDSVGVLVIADLSKTAAASVNERKAWSQGFPPLLSSREP
jgi:hypothetical protein